MLIDKGLVLAKDFEITSSENDGNYCLTLGNLGLNSSKDKTPFFLKVWWGKNAKGYLLELQDEKGVFTKEYKKDM